MRRNSSLVTTTHRGDPWPGPGSPPSQCFPVALCFFVHIVSFCNLLSTKALTLCFPGGPQVVGPLPRTAVMVSLPHLSFTFSHIDMRSPPRWELGQRLQEWTWTGWLPLSPPAPSPPWQLQAVPPAQLQPRERAVVNLLLLRLASLEAGLLSLSRARRRTSSQGEFTYYLALECSLTILQNFQHWCYSSS